MVWLDSAIMLSSPAVALLLLPDKTPTNQIACNLWFGETKYLLGDGKLFPPETSQNLNHKLQWFGSRPKKKS